jgi:hypothetical protein
MKKFSIASIAVAALAATVAIMPSANAVDEVTIFGGFGGDQAKGFQAELLSLIHISEPTRQVR